MIAACAVSEEVGLLVPSVRPRLRDLLERCRLPVGGVPREAGELLRFVRRDKKVERGRLRIVLTRGIGSASLVDSVGAPVLRKGFREICAPRR
jgi:3-dehydroquinate synthetase